MNNHSTSRGCCDWSHQTRIEGPGDRITNPKLAPATMVRIQEVVELKRVDSAGYAKHRRLVRSHPFDSEHLCGQGRRRRGPISWKIIDGCSRDQSLIEINRRHFIVMSFRLFNTMR